MFKIVNEPNRIAWVKDTLARVPAGSRILDAGAGEQLCRPFCAHLDYVSQDFCQYDVSENDAGLHTEKWDTSGIDLVSDITAIPEPDGSFDAVLCSEVLEHIPEPTKALDEFTRLLRPGGSLILTAPFMSVVHMAPYHYCSGFSRYWYEHHLSQRGYAIEELSPNGDWFLFCEQEVKRLGSTARSYRHWAWPVAYALSMGLLAYFKLPLRRKADDLACFGWQCVAVKGARDATVPPSTAAGSHAPSASAAHSTGHTS